MGVKPVRRMRTMVDDAEKETEQREEARAKPVNEDIGPNVFPTKDVGDAVTVMWGADKIQPRQYNSIEVPSFSVTTKVRPGETTPDAIRRALTDCANAAQEAFDMKLKQFAKNYNIFADKTDKL